MAEDQRPLAVLALPNYRRFIGGQAISLGGSWTETVAQAVLVLSLTHSGLVLGLATAARYAPVLALTPFAGVLADRDDKRRLLLVHSVLPCSHVGGLWCPRSERSDRAVDGVRYRARSSR